MGLIRAVLTHKTSELDLNDPNGNYHLARDFVPPPVALSANLARGTSANRFGGAELVSTRAVNRNFSFGVHITGASEAEIRRAISVLDSFIRRGTIDAPVFLQVRGSEDVGFEPLWGQFGSDLRYEIVFGRAAVSSSYTFGFARQEELPECGVNLDIKPFAVGLKQRVGSAVGGILEDTIGTVDGISRGTIIPEATTNKFTNPIFGHGTWNDGWTESGGLIASQNLDEKFISHKGTPNRSSAKLTDPSGGALFFQALTIGATTHTQQFYAKRPDGGTITISDCQIYFNNTLQTSVYINVGGGWWRVSFTGTGNAGAANYGVRVAPGRTVYVDGFQLEEKDHATPVAHGDLLGCAWTGTAHASTSTRTAARLRWPGTDIMDTAEGTFRVVWKADLDSADWTRDLTFTRDSNGTFRMEFLNASDFLSFTIGGDAVISGAQTWSAGDILILHAVYKPGSIKLYRDGAEIATGSSFTPQPVPTTLYLGSRNTVDRHTNGTYMDFATFAGAMTATEVSDDAANILEQIEDDRRLSPIPWLWTKDGDDIVDNHNDSGHDNFCVVGGVPGSAPAITRFNVLAGGTVIQTALWFSRFDTDPSDFSTTPGLIYHERQGSADAGSSEGEYELKAVTTSEQVWSAGPLFRDWLIALAGREVYTFVRLYDEGSNLQIAWRLVFGQSTVGQTDFVTPATAAAFRLHQAPPIVVPSRSRVFQDDSAYIDPDALITFIAKRTSGSANVRVDYFMTLPRPLTKISGIIVDNVDSIFVEGETAIQIDSATNNDVDFYMNVMGDIMEVLPEKLNMIISVIGDEAETSDITDTLTYNKMEVTPRWALL